MAGGALGACARVSACACDRLTGCVAGCVVVLTAGKNIKTITDKTGVRVQMPPRTADAPAPDRSVSDPLDEPQIEVTIEGDEINAKEAQAMVQAIVAERTSKITQRMTDIDHVYYPFIAGARDARVSELAATVGRGEVAINIPPRGAHAAARDGSASARYDPAIIVAGERGAVADVVTHIERDVESLRRSLRTLTISIPKRQHQFLTGEHAADILASTSCSIELPASSEAIDTVTIRGPQQQLPHALGAAMEKANAVRVDVVDLGTLHPGSGLEHAKRLAQWLANGHLPKVPGVQLFVPRPAAIDAAGSVQVEVVGADPAQVAVARAELERIATSLPPAAVRVVDIDPLLHRHVIGRKGQGVKQHEARGVDIVMPPEGTARSDVLLIASRTDANSAVEVLQSVEQDLLRTAASAADMHTEHLSVPARFHWAIIGPERTTLNAIMGEDRAVMVLLGQKGASARSTDGATPAPTEDSVVVRGPKDAVMRAVERIKSIADDAEQDAIINGHVEQLTIDASHAPRLIGRGGSAIAKLREQLGVKIEIDDAATDAHADSSRRQVKITGRKETAQEARARLEAQVHRLQDEVKEIIHVPRDRHGSLIGQGGRYVARLQDKYGVFINFPRTDGSARDDLKPDQVSIRGGKKGVAEAKGELLELLSYENERSNEEVLTLPRKALRRVLGRGGARINEIRSDSDAQIDVDDGKKNALPTIRLRGTKAAIAAARAAIEPVVAEVEAEADVPLTIPAHLHSNLIGRGGQNLRDLVAGVGGPEDRKAASQLVVFPRPGDSSDVVTVCAPKDLAPKIAAALEARAKELADRVVLGASVPTSAHRILISRGAQRHSEWQRLHKTAVVLPTWREYAELGAPANADDVAGADAATVVKVQGPEAGARAVLVEISRIAKAEQAKEKARAAARIDAEA